MFPESIAMRNMIDIHAHLIPGVDDGAEDLEMAAAMLWSAKEQGITGMILTPHSSAFDRFTGDGILQQYGKLCDWADRFLPEDFSLWPGCEIYCEPERMEEIRRALNREHYFHMACTEYFLMEFSQWVRPEEAVDCVKAAVSWGTHRPIIAHLERYEKLRGNTELAARFLELGAYIQINVYSLYDEMNADIRNWARQLVLDKKVTFLGTDAHRTYFRPPSVRMGLNWLYENCDEKYADQIAWKNAKQLLLYRD